MDVRHEGIEVPVMVVPLEGSSLGGSHMPHKVNPRNQLRLDMNMKEGPIHTVGGTGEGTMEVLDGRGVSVQFGTLFGDIDFDIHIAIHEVVHSVKGPLKQCLKHGEGGGYGSVEMGERGVSIP